MTTLAIADDVRALVVLARRLCANRADADDLVQDTIERALRAPNYVERGAKKGWLATILRNQFRDYHRGARREPIPLGSVDHAPMPEREDMPAWKRIDDAEIDAALSRLEPDFRRVYLLHASGKSYAEIAAELAIPLGTVGTRLSRARGKLKRLLRAP